MIEEKDSPAVKSRSFLAFLRDLFSRPRRYQENHMLAKDYTMPACPSVRLLDDDGSAITDGNDLAKDLGGLAEAVHKHAPFIGSAGIDHVIDWLNKWRGPDFVRKDPYGDATFHDFRLSSYEIEVLKAFCERRVAQLNANLEKRDDYHEGIERNTLIGLQRKLDAVETTHRYFHFPKSE